MLASKHDAAGAIECPSKDSDGDSGVVTFSAGDEDVDIRLRGRDGGEGESDDSNDRFRASLDLAFRTNTYEMYRNRFARGATFQDDVLSQIENRLADLHASHFFSPKKKKKKSRKNDF